ncbi:MULTISPECIES: helix-turn-helix domain-containing protein [unclassified Microbacterium]|uniref:helix-turn-helix domain-containing protein n=1 Tax=unclassified Microbacterium TaxID=2609290 RepID=UPI0038633ECA
MPPAARIHAWKPAVPGVSEVLHAKMTTHAYPAHVHGDWALMLVDRGAVTYDLGGRTRIADGSAATLLPPGVAHDGRAAPGSAGFTKRVAYLDAAWVAGARTGTVVDRPGQPELLRLTRAAHAALASPGDELAAEWALLTIAGRIAGGSEQSRDPAAAAALRDLLESRLERGITLADAGRMLHAHPGHLSRVFTATYGIPPHRYLTARRVDVARRHLLGGATIAAAAASAGFYDQAHLTRHFRRVLGHTPGAFARS